VGDQRMNETSKDEEILKLKEIIQKQEETICDLNLQIKNLLIPYNDCMACALSEDGQMCYDCFWGPDSD
jgi:hypothetical protein